MSGGLKSKPSSRLSPTMSGGSVVNILHWFVVVVVWQTGPWCTFHISEGTFTTNQCVRANNQAYQCTRGCPDQWVHIVSKKFQAGCPPSDSSYTLQSNISESLTVSCAGSQWSSSGSCSSGCLENVTAPDTYYGSNTTVTVEIECINESSIRNLCADLPDTPTDLLSLASPSLFLFPGPSPHTRCRCEIHAQPLRQVDILFADINTSMFTITCGQLIVSDGNFTTNVTNTVISLPDSSSDCVIDVDQRRADTTEGLPSHRVWANFIGSSITFRCNSYATSTPVTSTYTTPSSATKISTSQQTSSLLSTTNVSEAPPSAVSTTNIVAITTSRQTSEPRTTQGATTPGAVTSFQTSDNTLVVTQDSGDSAAASTRYIITGVCLGVIVLIAAVVGAVFFIRRSKTIYDSLGPRVPHSPGVETGDADHLYDVLQPAGMSSLQQSARAREDNQRLHRSEQLNVQDSNSPDEVVAPPVNHTPGYENVGMTVMTEAATDPQYINVVSDGAKKDN